tara:strand:+ start:861 stop:1319 length:459 start_codon:yes stop_codon:yes gene_type:complete
MKHCTGCDSTKALEMFHKKKNSKDGLTTECKQCRLERSKISYINRKAEIQAWCKAYKKTIAGKYSEYKGRSKQKGISFNLTKEEFSTFWKQDCSYCNRPILTIGIDRIDSTKGYSLDNCVPCCTICNTMKMDRPVDTWLSDMLMVLRHMEII